MVVVHQPYCTCPSCEEICEHSTGSWELLLKHWGKGHIMNGHTPEEPGHKLKSWHDGEISIYSTDLTHRNRVTVTGAGGLSAVRA